MERVSYFFNGGFVVHRAVISGSKCKFSAWFDADGKLLAAERFTWDDKRTFAATEKQRAELARLGRIYKKDNANDKL